MRPQVKPSHWGVGLTALTIILVAIAGATGFGSTAFGLAVTVIATIVGVVALSLLMAWIVRSEMRPPARRPRAGQPRPPSDAGVGRTTRRT